MEINVEGSNPHNIWGGSTPMTKTLRYEFDVDAVASRNAVARKERSYHTSYPHLT